MSYMRRSSWSTVDLPDPDDPTRATVLPWAIRNEKFSRMGWSGRDGYAKSTFSNTISPADGWVGGSALTILG